MDVIHIIFHTLVVVSITDQWSTYCLMCKTFEGENFCDLAKNKNSFCVFKLVGKTFVVY